MATPLEKVKRRIDREQLVEDLSSYKGLRRSKPDADGLTQYVWRMARFWSGDDEHMPMTATWWLQDWLDAEGIDASVSGIVDDDGKEITDYLDELAIDILREDFNREPTAGRWGRVLSDR